MLIDFSLEAVKITKQHVSTYAGRILSNRYRRWLREKKNMRKKNCLASFAERLLQMLNLSKKVQQEKMA